MAVLITGGAGYIGSHMVWELVDAGESVVVLDNLSSGFSWAIAPGAELVIGDVCDTELVRGLIVTHQIESIIHFAGSIVVPDSVRDPLAYYNNNTAKSRTLIETAVDNGVRHFIFSSTAAVYGYGGDGSVTEDAVLAPQSPYGRSKLMTEWMLRDTAAVHSLRYTALRYFNVAGADPETRAGQSTPEATHLIKVACETALGKRPYMEIYGTNYPTRDGTCIRDYIHVSDLVHAHRLALERLRAGGESLVANCGYGHGYSVLEVVESVRKVFGKGFEVRMADARPGDPPAIVADSTLARSQLGWRPNHDSLDQIVHDTLAWETRLTEIHDPSAMEKKHPQAAAIVTPAEVAAALPDRGLLPPHER